MEHADVCETQLLYMKLTISKALIRARSHCVSGEESSLTIASKTLLERTIELSNRLHNTACALLNIIHDVACFLRQLKGIQRIFLAL